MEDMQKKAIFIAATGQNVGKTTVCLGLISGLKKRFPRLGFMKPIGQQHETISDQLRVDKDVVLFKEYFKMPFRYEDMSPVIFPSGFTREFLDGKVNEEKLRPKIAAAYQNIASASDFAIVEGTGHTGVGSIVNLNNVDVASFLKLEIVIIARGGVGSAFDELALNKAMCDQLGIRWKGVILNRVYDEKRDMVMDYMTKALSRWNIPLIGCIPYNKFLNTPSMEDFENLFNTSLISGKDYHYRHFETIRLVATSVDTFKELIFPGQLIVTPATREDIVVALIEKRLLYAKKEEPEN
jgi:phosphate acetyltransferase